MRKENRYKRDKQIVAMLKRGVGPSKAADAMDVSERWVRMVAKSNGLKLVRVYTTAKSGK